MCLSIAVEHPDRVLSRGEHLGFEYIVTHNGDGYRCGYVKVPPGHPWHGKGYNDVDADVHGGLTFGEADIDCGKDGPDNAHWLGFDCAHGGDARDPSLPRERMSSGASFFLGGFHIWTADEVSAECKDLCRQAAEASMAILSESN